jgi:N-acetylglucosamine-6-sulfatase
MVAPVVAISQPVAQAAGTRPNVVIIMTDDQRWDTVTAQYMPQLSSILANNPSVTFTNSFVPNTLCCPSRTSTLSGDYSHTTGVYGNGGQYGGFPAFTPTPNGNSISLINDTTTIAVDMHQVGYKTALVGKYLNGYNTRTSRYIPPGWDRWFSVPTGAYYHYWAASNFGGPIHNRYFGTTKADYITRVLTARASTFLQANQANPFFLYYAVTAPHRPATADPRDVNHFNIAGYVQPPSFGASSALDPLYIQNRPWDPSYVKTNNEFHAAQLNATFGIDRSIGQLWKLLPENTIVAFMSDNGFSWGEHRWSNKMIPYNEDLRIPMRLVGKNLANPLAAGTVPRIVLNIDLLPTLEVLAGVTTSPSRPTAPEGMDMLGSATRSEFVIEHWHQENRWGYEGNPPTYCGVRSLDWMFVKYNHSEESNNFGLYDETNDPYELSNLASDPAFATQLRTMKDLAHTAAGDGLCDESATGIYPNDWPYQ